MSSLLLSSGLSSIEIVDDEDKISGANHKIGKWVRACPW